MDTPFGFSGDAFLVQSTAVEAGQMSAAEKGQMSVVETRQMSTVEAGLCPVPILYICLVSTCTSKDLQAH